MLFRSNTVSLNMKRGYNFKTFALNCDLAMYTLLIDISFLLHNVWHTHARTHTHTLHTHTAHIPTSTWVGSPLQNYGWLNNFWLEMLINANQSLSLKWETPLSLPTALPSTSYPNHIYCIAGYYYELKFLRHWKIASSRNSVIAKFARQECPLVMFYSLENAEKTRYTYFKHSGFCVHSTFLRIGLLAVYEEFMSRLGMLKVLRDIFAMHSFKMMGLKESVSK